MKRAVQNAFAKAGQAWFSLTIQERVTALIITGIFLLGAITRWLLR